MTLCLWCGEDVREPAPAAEDQQGRVHGPLTVIDGTAPGSTSRSASGRPGRAAAAARPALTPREMSPPTDRRRIELPKLPAVRMPTFSAPEASAAGAVEAPPDPVRRLKSRLVRSGTGEATAAAVAPAMEVRNVVLASAIYMTGSRGLLAGSRYGIALVGDDLHILGPVDVDPSAVVIVHSLRGVDATGLQGRLIITAGERRRDRLALVFMSVAGGSAEGVAETIVTAASELEPDSR